MQIINNLILLQNSSNSKNYHFNNLYSSKAANNNPWKTNSKRSWNQIPLTINLSKFLLIAAVQKKVDYSTQVMNY